MAQSETNNGAAQAAPAPTGHSRFGASKSDRWMNCPASVGMEAGLPDETSIYAQEGTAGHAVAALCLTNDQDAIEYVDRTIEGVEITEELAEAVQVYLDTIRGDKAARGGKIMVETGFHLDWLHPEFYGTSDCARLGTDNVLSVYDLKLGKGKAVEVEGNPQLAYYALGAIERFPKTLKIEKIELVVVQPRRHHKDGAVRRAPLLDHTDLLDLSAALVEAAAEADGPSPTIKSGDWCTFCKAKFKCPAVRRKALEIAQLDFDDETAMPIQGKKLPDIFELSNEQVADVLRAADMIESWVSAIRHHAWVLASGGQTVPGFKLADKRATRKWKDDTRAANDLLLVHGLDESSIYSKKLLSPAQVEKLLSKEARNEIAELYSKESSGTKLVPDEDDRPARLSRPAQAQIDFDDTAKSASAEDEW